MSNMITELLELHDKCEGQNEIWCGECIEISDDTGEMIRGEWPCETVKIIQKHYPELVR